MKRLDVGKQRGVALITAVLMVALATVLAVEIGFKGYLSQRRAMTVFALDQSYQVALGAEALAADILMAADAKRTDLAQAWAAPITGLPIEVGGEGGGAVGEISGQLEDLTGRFNINLLAEPANPGDPAQVAQQKAYLAQFKRILEMVQLEPHWAEKIADWVDADIQPTFPDGAEDNAYTSLTPPYHTANRRITRVSELLALPEFGLERYRKLEPLVAALPADAKINVCTAPGIVLDSFSAAQRQYSLDLEWLAKQRGNGCFPEQKVLEAVLTPPEKDHLTHSAAETGNYFRATIRVAIGSAEFTLYSLLKRDEAGVRPITRSFGTL
jgi:general secretion pathway protein K